MELPNKHEFNRAIAAYKQNEKRDAMYVVATYWVEQFWNDSHQVSNGLGVLLLTWNDAFYRYGPFDYDELADCVESNRPSLEKLRNKELRRITDKDGEIICDLFGQFQHALRSQRNSGEERFTPVGTVKALHLLAPSYFPLWDGAIAEAYDCEFADSIAAEKYLEFCHQMLEIKKQVIERKYVGSQENPLKKIDEYNYVTYTKPKWLDKQ